MTDAEQHAAEVHDRLWNPTNAVVDRGIDLKRKTDTPKPVKKTNGHPANEILALSLLVHQLRSEMAELREFLGLSHVDETANDLPPTIHRIIEVVTKHYGMQAGEIVGPDRHAKTTMPRHIAMYLAKKFSGKSYPIIGRAFGGRDHSTVVVATRKIENLSASDPATQAVIMELMEKLGIDSE